MCVSAQTEEGESICVAYMDMNDTVCIHGENSKEALSTISLGVSLHLYNA